MKKSIRILAIVVAALMLMAFFTACGKSVTSNDAKTTAQNLTVQNPLAQKVSLRMFMCDAGMKPPDDVKVDDNKYINTLKEKLNIDLTIDKPTYADFQTKYNLMLSSGDIPDIVHTIYPDTVSEMGMKGAFIDLTDFINKSSNLKNKFTKTDLMSATSTDGKIYGIPQLGSPWDKTYHAPYARTDLLKELNGGVVPKTPDEWYDVMKKEKAKYPDSIPFTCNSTFYTGTLFFMAYGAPLFFDNDPWFCIQPDDTVITGFEKPEFKQAILFYKKLYDEGLMDKEFATNDSAKRAATFTAKKGIVGDNSPSQVPGMIFTARKVDPNAMYEFIPYPAAPGVTAPYANTRKKLGVNFHRISVSTVSKNRDRALAVLDYIASDEWRDTIFWGLKDDGYTVSNGQKVSNTDNWNKENWRRSLSLIWGYSAVPEVYNAASIQQVGPDYMKCVDTMKVAYDSGEKGGYFPFNLKPAVKGVDEKKPDAENFIFAATAKAVTGAISMAEFDNQVKLYKQQYGAITDEATKWWKANKTKIEPLLK